MHVHGFLLCLFPMAAFGIVVTDPPPSGNEYKYSYDIVDPATGDTKSQHEVRRGDVVSGSYSLVDPDGTRRTVKYSADPQHGFTAFVHREALPGLHAHQDEYQISPAYVAKESPFGPVLYAKLSYPNTDYEEKPAFYFTPANEIKSDRESFAQGQYFQPVATNYDKN